MPMTTDLYQDNRYVVRRKIFTLAGAKFRVLDSSGNLAFYSKQKAFKLKEDIRLFADETMATELLLIKARKVLDFSAAYDVIDSQSQTKVGAYKRKGLKSFLKDEWIIMDNQDNEIGLIEEDSMLLALIRRFVMALIPQSFQVKMNGATVCTLSQNFNPFTLRMTVDFSPDANAAFDRRMGIAAALLLCAIEGRQD
ncbi:MAG: hypothetical protein HY706_19955 [Candidatus Hydrogenedentes bacterium]|nr:hypothetical protein [Candidatus Hydrogenedentota bacterium]